MKEVCLQQIQKKNLLDSVNEAEAKRKLHAAIKREQPMLSDDVIEDLIGE